MMRVSFDELSTFGVGVDPLTVWLPCEYPERPIDRNAAETHMIRKGDDEGLSMCRACGVAWEADKRRNRSGNV